MVNFEGLRKGLIDLNASPELDIESLDSLITEQGQFENLFRVKNRESSTSSIEIGREAGFISIFNYPDYIYIYRNKETGSILTTTQSTQDGKKRLAFVYQPQPGDGLSISRYFVSKIEVPFNHDDELFEKTIQQRETIIYFGEGADTYYHVQRQELFVDGQMTNLRPKEKQILLCLAARHGKVVSQAEILETVWEIPFHKEDIYLLRPNISGLRQKIEPDSSNYNYIKTRKNIGYLLDNVRIEGSIKEIDKSLQLLKKRTR